MADLVVVIHLVIRVVDRLCSCHRLCGCCAGRRRLHVQLFLHGSGPAHASSVVNGALGHDMGISPRRRTGKHKRYIDMKECSADTLDRSPLTIPFGFHPSIWCLMLKTGQSSKPGNVCSISVPDVLLLKVSFTQLSSKRALEVHRKFGASKSNTLNGG